MENKRLEYVDAMRGFTMMLVVIWHVCFFSYHEGAYTIITFNSAILKFMIPLFFFISGFVSYKSTRIWNLNTSKEFFYKKFMHLIIPTVVFLVIYDLLFGYQIINSFFNSLKYGYWFTIALFEYFVLYVFISLVFLKYNNVIKKLGIVIVCICTLFGTESYRILQFALPVRVLDLFCLSQFHFFVFFLLGILIRRYFTRFCSLSNNGYVMAAILILFFAEALFYDQLNEFIMPSGGWPFVLMDKLRFILSGFTGLTIVFTFFRKNKKLFISNTYIGRSLQYIGRRTLDVYLLHYFFLPHNLEMLGQFFKHNSNPSVEFLISLFIAIWVILLSLIMSKIIRLSGFFEHRLFGVKKMMKA